ncbi:MAG: proline--tRNA ligase [Chloroflexi bacterium]|nr:proline--tRNA ligase [Chloroflexota bacterium]
MRLSNLFGKTQRQVPAEAEIPSHQLLLKVGMIQQVAAGVYSYLPLGWRVLRKIETIIREEMDTAGGQELMLPVLQPIELWEESGRHRAFGEGLFTLKDRRGRRLVLGPTHEEVIIQLIRQHVRSYRDLPLMLYQIQTKFRDEPRSRGGLIRVREFHMKDLYSFDADEDGLDISYNKMVEAYRRICQRCGLPFLAVEADSGAIGGKDSQEFMVIAEAGEDEVIYCPQGHYAANKEKAQSAKAPLPAEELLPLVEIATTGVGTIEELANFLVIPHSRTLKAVFYWADEELVFVVIRGDLGVNEIKLRNTLKCFDLRLATEAEVMTAGLVVGSASPVGLAGVKVVADDSITMGANFVVGANKPGYHLKNANYPRDFGVDILTDIALAEAGQGCPKCGEPLLSTRAIEVGHVFKLGTVYSENLGALYLDREGRQRPIVMGCYGIGVGRLMAAVIERNHDPKGIVWPPSIAPFQVYLCPLAGDEQQVVSKAEEIYRQLQVEGFEVLYDDRSETPGVKMNDADLLGIPIRLVISPRTLERNGVEVKRRWEKSTELLPWDEVIQRLPALIASFGSG